MSILKLKDSQGNWVGVPTIKGAKGDNGNGISSAVLNNDYTLTLTFTDGTTYTTPSIRGEKGEKGEPATDMDIHICSASEYDSETRVPTISDPDDKTFYLVPTEDGTSPDLFTEWVYVNNAWEMFGSMKIDLSGYLTDVTVDGTSIVTDGVAEIPIASTTQAGVVKVNSTGANGLLVDNQELFIIPAASNIIKDGIHMFRPIAPKRQHESTFYGLAKASGTDEKDSILPVGQYTDEAKSSIQDMLDVPSTSELKEVNDSKADVIVESASGDIISFDDGADNMPLKSLVVDINPVQNLNGYDSPWVGGDGKNLLDPLLLKDQEAWNIIEMEFPEGTRLLMSTNKPSTAYTGGLFLYFRNGDVDTLSTADAVYNNQSVVHTVNSSGKIQIVQRNRDKTDSFANYWYQLEVMTSGTTPTDYAPYENICPISGHEAVNVYDDPLYGGNVEWNQRVNFSRIAKTSNGIRIDVESDGTLSLSGVADTTYRTFYSEKHVIKGHKYLERFTTVSNPNNIRMRFNVFQGGMTLLNTYSYNKSLFGIAQKNDSIGMGVEGFVAGDVLDGIKIKVGLFDLTQMFGETVADYIYSLEAANEGAGVAWFDNLFPNDYYPYNIGEKTTVSAVNGKPYTYVNTPLGQTVYGGRLDVLSGMLTVDRAMVDLGTLNWSDYSLSSNCFKAILSDGKVTRTNYSADGICSSYAKANYITTLRDTDKTFGIGYTHLSANVCHLAVHDSSYSDAATFKTAMSGVQLCYELAEPIEIQLSTNQINSLLGVNNIWADTGNTSVEYCADTEMYIEKVKPIVNVDDVQINGTSIVENGVANVPIATQNMRGVVKGHSLYGVGIYSDGTLYLKSPSDSTIKKGTDGSLAITSRNQDSITFYGLAKAASDTTQSQSSNAVGNYTNEAKSSIQNMLGITDKYSPKEWIAESETELVTNAHSVGDLFYIGETLYKVIADLNAGDAINVGVNVEEVDVNNILDDYATKEDVQDNVSIVEKSASGSIVSFVDGADDIPLKSLVVDIDPVQDLHGQESPYPAGGGKNKIPFPYNSNSGTVDGITYTIGDDGKITATGTTERGTNFFFVRNMTLTAGTYTASVIGDFAGLTLMIYDSVNKVTVCNILPAESTHYKTFTIESDKTINIYLNTGQTGVTVDISAYFQLEQGSTATAYAPYENICPISGWTEVNVEQSGVNLFDKAKTVTGYIDDFSGTLKTQGVGQYSKATDFILVKPNMSYYIKSEQTKGSWGAWYDKDKNYISGIMGYIATASDVKKTKTAPSNAYYMRLTVEYYESNTVNGNVDTFSINYPSTDHDYHPYTGRSITIQLGQTVYGGKLDVLSGELTVMHKGVDMGTLSWNMQAGSGTQLPRFNTSGISSDVSREQTQAGYTVMLDLKVPILIPHENPVYSRNKDNTMCVACATGVFYAICTAYTSAADFKAAVSGMMLVYRLAEPITIQLTPNQVNSLLGVNNIWADSGDTSVEYFSQVDKDLIDYIETSLKPYAKEERLNDYVSDVQVNGTSIVTNNVANVPIATQSVIGALYTASEADGKVGTHTYCAIVPQMQHSSVFYGLAKAAGDVTQSQSSNAVGNYTEDAKSAISDMLNGAIQISGIDPTIVAKSGIRYVCGEVLSLNFTPSASGICDVMFTSGSTPTVLTLPNTVKMPEWFSIEANTTYEINIADGIYGVVTSWTL